MPSTEATIKWRKHNEDKIRAYSKRYYAEHKEKCRARKQNEKYRAYCRTYDAKRYTENPAKSQAWSQAWKERNRERTRKYALAWAAAHPEQVKERRRAFYQRHKKEPLFNFKMRLRKSLWKALQWRGLRKTSGTFSLLGFTPQALYAHLVPYLERPCAVCEKVILKLNNCHIDHIVPLATATNEESVLALNKLINLRLICGHCNTSKGALSP